IPPLWGYLADRSGRGPTLLAVATGSWAMALALLFGARSFPIALGVMAVQALFGPSLSPLIDAQAVGAAQRAGVAYARVRLWGSVGFVVTSLAFGQALARGVAPSWVIPAGFTAALVATGMAVMLARRAPGSLVTRPPSPREAVGLLRQRGLVLFLGAAGLHWASFAPYTMFLALHLERVTGSKDFVGPSLAVAVGAEVLGMRYFSHLQRCTSPLRLLILCFLVNALRWWAMTCLEGGVVLVVLQIVHGLGFGVFFVASIAHLEREIPASLRSTGRALFGAVAFGLGGAVGNLMAGWCFDHEGTRGAFETSILLEIGAVGLLAPLAARSPREPDLDSSCAPPGQDEGLSSP
ncbi:MAG: MFS transporter, partial [Myxococcales bacterium]|nr:MFS transporter [Polyangiaceae bacterium]MDW8251167.1 MFS transporter [Myxococcales bacterium]